MSEYSAAEKVLASTLAKTLQRRRKALNLSQEQVALKANLDPNHYQLMESARSDRKRNSPLNPRLSTLIALASVLECSVPDLLDDALLAHAKAKAEEETVLA